MMVQIMPPSLLPCSNFGEHREANFPRIPERRLRLPAGVPPRPTLAPDLANAVDGRAPFLLHLRKSSNRRVPDVQQNTGRTPNAGQVTPISGYVTPESF